MKRNEAKKKVAAARDARRKEARVSSSAIAMLNHAMIAMPTDVAASHQLLTLSELMAYSDANERVDPIDAA